MERRLAAILLTDIVGYSTLMGIDEAGTIARQKSHRAEIIDPKISEHCGRIVKATGDGVLAEFPSVVDAVASAIEIQQELGGRDGDVPEDRRIRYRIGINLGDVVVDGDDILGDGVNIAARLEALASPGGICLSGAVIDQLVGKLDVSFADGGEQTVKNVPRAVRVWHWNPGDVAGAAGQVAVPENSPIAGAYRPSIAVLPFENLSPDPEQDYLADGMTEDITAGLSRFSWLMVIARRSTLAYKCKARDVREIARELQVRYILEGSVRSAGNRVRITVDLVDAETGNQMFSEKFDRVLEDIFAVQDEVAVAIISAITPEIGRAEIFKTKRKPPGNLDAWGQYQRALSYYFTDSQSGRRKAIELFDRAHKADPNFVDALAMASLIRSRAVYHYAPEDSETLIEEAQKLLQTAASLDDSNVACKAAMGRLQIVLGNYEHALSECSDALALNPNSMLAQTEKTMALHALGRWAEALEGWERMIRMSPRDPLMPGFLGGRSHCLFLVGYYEETIEVARKALARSDLGYHVDAILVAALAKQERRDELDAAKNALMAKKPDFSISELYKSRALWPEVIIDALRQAELPE